MMLEACTINPVSLTQEISGHRALRKCLNHLLGSPPVLVH